MRKEEGSIYSLDTINNGALLQKRRETLPEVYYDRPLYPRSNIRTQQKMSKLATSECNLVGWSRIYFEVNAYF
jgi:hypothetical protein